MTLFRNLTLPEQVPGGLYLHSMPGRCETLEQSWAQVAQLRITRIVCLAPDGEVGVKSPDYAAAIAEGTLPCEIRRFPIADYQGPIDLKGFWQLARETADALRRGENVLVHCGAGIGRTGTFAIAVLLALGVPIGEAKRLTRAAESGPEMPSQWEALQSIVKCYLPASR
jgi:protein-tyrosine phosphatase